MTLLVRNLQRAVQLNISKTKHEVQALRRIMHIDRFDLAVLCVEDEKIRDLNRMYRGVDKATDVLSFPASEVGLVSRVKLWHAGFCSGPLECWQVFSWACKKGPIISCSAGCHTYQIGMGDTFQR